MLDVALDLIDKGYHIFQVKSNDKGPLFATAPNGCNSATSDPAIVREWFTKYPDANIGIKCDNVLVLDLDVADGIDGTIDVIRLQRELGDLPAEPRVETPSGGYHLYFRRPEGVRIKGNTKVSYRGRQTGIDIRVGSQYVVAPGSTINELTYNGVLPPVSELPELPQRWIDDFLPKHEPEPARPETPKKTLERESSRGEVFDNYSRARAYLSQLEPAVSGQNGHNQLLWATRVIFWGWRLSDEQAWTLLREYNEICQPPWSERELQHKVESVKNTEFRKPYGWLADEERLKGKATLIKNINTCNDPTYNPFAKKTAQPSVPIVPGAETDSGTGEQRRLISITGKELCEKNIKYPEFIIEPWFRQAECALIYAQRGIGKSWFALGLAKAITSCKWALGSPVWESPKPRHVLYIDGEMAGADLQQRAKSLELNLDLIHFVNQELSGLDGGLDLYQDADQVLVLDEAIRVGAEVIIVDNIATLYYCDKPNDSASWHKYNQFILACRRAGIAVIFIDHCGKNNEKGANGSHAKQNIVNHCIRLDKLAPLDGEGSRFVVRFEKSRSCYGSAIASLTLAVKDGKLQFVAPKADKKEAQAVTTGEATVPDKPEPEKKQKKAKEPPKYKQVIQMLANGMAKHEVRALFSKGTYDRGVIEFEKNPEKYRSNQEPQSD